MLDTTLRFGDDRRAEVEMTAVSLAVVLPVSPQWTARFSVGVVTDGFVQPNDGLQHDVLPGGLIAVGAERPLRPAVGLFPAVDLAFSLSASWSKTEAPDDGVRTSFLATDARLGVRAVWPLERHLFPYLATRVFGGPVNWEWEGEEVTGSDVHHVQVAVGAAAQWGIIGLFGEWAALGEQGFSAGVSTAW